LTVPLSADASSASTKVKCGQIITQSIRLANDLVNCPGTGLVIGADRITIDLAGHSISGVNASGSEGIADDGQPGARILNGRIERFLLSGVGLRKAPQSTVSNLTIRAIGAGGVEPLASAGVLVKNSPNTSVLVSTIANDVAAYQSDGVDVLSSKGTVVTGNRLLKNAWNGVFVLDSPATNIIGNTFDGNQHQGLEMNLGSDRSVLAWNYVAHSVSNGLVVGAVSGARIEHNVLAANGDSGIFMFDLHASRINQNRASGNAVGIDLEGGQNGSSGNEISGNDTSRNQFVGIVVADSDHNLLAGNVASANLGAPGEGGGIVLVSAKGNVVRANLVTDNRDVGIGIVEQAAGDASGNTLARNTALRNGAHGIDAVAGTVDGGGNVAHGNTPLPNCLAVSCG
jgi:parallel beta-helix repeat protein